jgi:chromosome partitioning protein
MKTKVLAITAQKGGSGKTTLAFNLAVTAISRGLKVAVIDIDAQKSASKLLEERQKSKNLAVIDASPEQLEELLKHAKKGGVDLVIIDTAPTANHAAALAAGVADFVLVPCRPEKIDLDALFSTLSIVELSKTPFAVVINAAPIGKRAEIVKEGLRQNGVPVFDTVLHNRVAFSRSLTDSRSVDEYEPDGKAAAEINDLFTIISNGFKL